MTQKEKGPIHSKRASYPLFPFPLFCCTPLCFLTLKKDLLALYDFAPTADGAAGQIPLKAGSRYKLVHRDPSGWWTVHSLATNQRGAVPGSYLAMPAFQEASQRPEFHGRAFQHEIEAALDKQKPGTYLLHEHPKNPGQIVLTFR